MAAAIEDIGVAIGRPSASPNEQKERKVSHDGQVCIVTGAAQGLGFAIAKAFTGAGALVAMVDVNAEKVKAAATSLDPTGARVIAVGTDLTKSADVNAMVQSVVARFARIDVLVNNAGGSGDVGIRDIEDITDELWDLIIDRNLKTAFLCCRAAVPFMRAQGSGRIVNFSSRSYLGSAAALGTSAVRLAYCAAKGGIHGFTNQLSKDLQAEGITVNIVMPGLILTEAGARVRERYEMLTAEEQARMDQAWRSGGESSPDDIAAAVLFFASAGARTVNGQTVSIG